MPRQYAIGEAARLLGISLDTLRRWDREGRIKTRRDRSNRRVISASEIERIRGRDAAHEPLDDNSHEYVFVARR